MSALLSAIPGVTYRQLDHWTKRGWLRPVHDGRSGVPREWSDTEVSVARLMVRLRDGGLSVETAARVARETIETGVTAHLLGKDVWLILTPPAGEQRGRVVA